MEVRLDQYAEACAHLEAYKNQFITDVTSAWDNYVLNTIETVEMEATLHREVVEDTINYLWDRSAFPGPSLDDVYPRPEVSFAAKNRSLSKGNSRFNYRTIAWVVFVVFDIVAVATMIWYFKNQKSAPKVVFEEEPIELDTRK